MPQTDVIREFMVALGWRNDTNSERRFVAAIEGATTRANILAKSIEDMAAKVSGAMSSLGEQGSTIYRLMEITGASSQTILGMRNAFQQLSLGAGAADSFLVKVRQSLNKYGDANQWFYKQIGFSKSASGELLFSVKQGHEALSKMTDQTITQWANVTGADVNFLQFLKQHSDEVQKYFSQTSESMKAFGISDDDFKKQQDLYDSINHVWIQLGNAWKRLGTDLGTPVTEKLDELADWMTKNHEIVEKIEAFVTVMGVLGGGAVLGGLARRGLGFAFGKDATNAMAEFGKSGGLLNTAGGSLQTAAGQLTGAATELNQAAIALQGKGSIPPGGGGPGKGGGPGRSPSGPEVTENAPWWRSVPAAGALGFAAALSLIFGEASGQKGIQQMLRRAHPRATDEEIKAWAAQEARRLQEEQQPHRPVTPTPTHDIVHRPVTSTPMKSWWRKIFGAADIPTEQAQAASFEMPSGGAGFRIPGTNEQIGFGGGKETALTVGGSPVQSGNPLPVRVEKIDPLAFQGGSAATGAGTGEGGRAGLFDYMRRHGGAGWTGTGNKGIGGWWTPERMKYASDYLMEHAGLSKQGAAGLVARWAAVEAPGGPTSVNPTSGAAGIAQGLGDRRAGYTGSFDEQLANAARELRTTEKAAGDALRAARTPSEGARGASMFERAEGYNRQTGTDYFTGATPVEKTLEAIDKASNKIIAKPAIKIPNVYQGGQSSEYPAPGEVGIKPQSYLEDQFRSPLMHHYDQSDNSITHNNNQHVTVNVTGVSDPHEAGRAVGSSLAQIFPEAKSATRHLTPALT